MPEQELTRRAMYDLVWSRPMTNVAEDFGISDVRAGAQGQCGIEVGLAFC